MSKDIEIKPCPFCGRNPYLSVWEEGFIDAVLSARVKCFCGVLGPVRHGRDCKEQAVLAWDKRA